MYFKVLIDGIDRTYYVVPSSLNITDSIESQVDKCSFDYETTNVSDKPIEGQEIVITMNVDDEVIYAGDTSRYSTERVFGGQIVSAPEEQIVPGEYVYNVDCVDYQRQMDKRLVIKKYENMYAGDIVKDIITNYTSGFTTNGVEKGDLVSYIPFNYKYPSQCIKELADLTGFHWYSDYHKDIKFFDEFKYNAPISLDDSQSNFSNLELEADISQIRNRVYFRGGTYLSDPFTETQTGGKEVWNMGYKPHDMAITVNGVSKTVGTENLHNAADYDFLVNYQEKHVVPGALSTTSTDEIKFTYSYNVPVLTVQDDIDSINRMKEIEGGDGIYEHIIVDKEVESKDLARQRSQADLDQFSNPLISGSFMTNEKGLRSGQLLHIQQTKRNIDDYFLIRSVSMKWLTLGKYEYSVKVASKLKGLEELLIDLFGQSRQIEVREDEVLDKLLILRDKASFTDDLTISTGAPESRIGYARIGYGEVS